MQHLARTTGWLSDLLRAPPGEGHHGVVTKTHTTLGAPVQPGPFPPRSLPLHMFFGGPCKIYQRWFHYYVFTLNVIVATCPCSVSAFWWCSPLLPQPLCLPASSAWCHWGGGQSYVARPWGLGGLCLSSCCHRQLQRPAGGWCEWINGGGVPTYRWEKHNSSEAMGICSK